MTIDANDLTLFRAAKKQTNMARRSDGKTVVTCPATRHAQTIAESIGERKPYPMLQEEPEHCAESILSAVASVYRLRLRVFDLEEALKRIADIDPAGQRADDLGRAARIASAAIADGVQITDGAKR